MQESGSRLKVCCSGLLEVQQHRCTISDPIFGDREGLRGRLQYLYRTIRDCLERPEIWASIVVSNSATDFDPYICFLQTSVLQLKTALSHISVWRVVLTAFEAASYDEFLSRLLYDALIGEMHECLSRTIKDWCSVYFAWLFNDSERLIGNNNRTFLAALVHYDLSASLTKTLERHSKNKMNASHYGLLPYLDWKYDHDEFPEVMKASPLLNQKS
jgi:hypothetical protein